MATQSRLRITETGKPAGWQNVREMILRARRATQQRDWLEAWRCWELVRACWPHHAPAYSAAGNALREARSYDQAEEILAAGAERFPDDEQIAIARAWLASVRCDWPAAIGRWQAVCGRYPHYAAAYVGAGNALREAGRYGQAEAILAIGAERFPDDEQIAIAHAWLASVRCDWPTALRRWQTILARSPHHAPAYVNVGNALCEAGSLDQSEAVLSAGAERFPDDEQIAIARAWLANARCDWPTALSRWEVVCARSPHHAPAYVGTANALREAGRLDEAEALLASGAERFPDDEQIAIARAWLSNARRDWPAALSRWEAARARFPGNPWCYLGNFYALKSGGLIDQAQSLLSAAEAALTAAQQNSLNDTAVLRVERAIAKARSE